MRFFLILGIALFTAKIVLASDGKGTIGLMCIDERGRHHFWYADRAKDFTNCVDRVVMNWTEKKATVYQSESEFSDNDIFKELIRGLDTYSDAAARFIDGRDTYRTSGGERPVNSANDVANPSGGRR